MNQEAFKCYMLNIPTIDKQHWELIALLNSLCHQRRSTDIFNENILIEIVKKLQDHFVYEEQYMRNIEYPYLRFHLIEHAKIMIAMEDILKTKNTATDFTFIINDLKAGLIDHIDSFDMKISDYEANRLL